MKTWDNQELREYMRGWSEAAAILPCSNTEAATETYARGREDGLDARRQAVRGECGRQGIAPPKMVVFQGELVSEEEPLP